MVDCGRLAAVSVNPTLLRNNTARCLASGERFLRCVIPTMEAYAATQHGQAFADATGEQLWWIPVGERSLAVMASTPQNGH